MFMFFFDRGRPEHEFGELTDELIGQHHPEFVSHEGGHFLLEEIGVLVGRLVATTFNTRVALFVGPVRGGGLGRHPFVPPMAEQLGSWMINVVKVLG